MEVTRSQTYSLHSPPSPIKKLPGDDRLTTFPISRPGIFEYYKDAELARWGVNEVTLSKDAEDWSKLSKGQQQCVKAILAFFAAGDKIVNINILKRFRKDVPILEVEYFYDSQVAMENVHAHMYSLLLDTIIPDAKERERLLNAATQIPTIKLMSDYMFKCINSEEPFAKRILRMVCVEGVFFTGCFCIIYWLTSHGLMPGLGHSNELIARDESLHATFAMFLYDLIEPQFKLKHEEIYEIFAEAVNIASEFVKYALPEGMPEMNQGLMIAYVQCCADNLLALISVPPLYKVRHDFHFMEQINLKNRTGFFERRVSEYGKPKSADRVKGEVKRDF
jgi:ribonucleotide reductase beta subunit family protein with ferritin-like domain